MTFEMDESFSKPLNVKYERRKKMVDSRFLKERLLKCNSEKNTRDFVVCSYIGSQDPKVSKYLRFYPENGRFINDSIFNKRAECSSKSLSQPCVINVSYGLKVLLD